MSGDARPVAVVTGAARGLGRTTALSFGRAGYRVVATARSSRDRRNPVFDGTVEEVGEELAEQGVEALVLRADLSDPNDIERIHSETIGRFQRCDVLVNNAAYSPIGEFSEMSPSKWRAALTVNVWAPAALARLFMPEMIERGAGHVINIGSAAAVENLVRTAPYCVTKAALERLTETMDLEIRDLGLSAICVRIDERIKTEADLLMRDNSIGVIADSEMSPTDFGEAVVWVAEKQGLGGRIIGLEELRQLMFSSTSV